MTRSIERALASYLSEIDQLAPRPLGATRRRSLTEEDSQYLRDSLNRQLRFNNSLILVATVLLCGLFVLGVFLILAQRNSVSAVSIISGTTFAAMVGIIAFLRRLWLDKSTMDMLLFASIGLSAEETAKLVTSYYFKAIEPRALTRT